MVGHGFAELFFLGLQLRALCVSGDVYGRVRVWQFSGQWRGSIGVLGRDVSIGGEDRSRRNKVGNTARLLRKEWRGWRWIISLIGAFSKSNTRQFVSDYA